MGGVCLFVGVMVQLICTWLIGAPVLAKSGRFDMFTELYLLCKGKCCRKDVNEKKQQELEVIGETSLIGLKKKTIAFVKNEDIDDVDYLMKFLVWSRLAIVCLKCGIDLD